MRTELILFLIVALIAVFGMIQIETTGLISVSPATLNDYPFIFFEGKDFNAVISKGEVRDFDEIKTANLFITQLPEQYMLLEGEGSGHGAGNGYSQIRIFPEDLQGKVATGYYDYQKLSAIVIGTPCNNKIVAELLTVAECETHFLPGQGYVRLIEAFGNYYLIVTGNSGKDVFSAAQQFMSLAQRRQATGTELITETGKGTPLRLGKPIVGPSEAIHRQRVYRTTGKNELNILGERFYRVG